MSATICCPDFLSSQPTRRAALKMGGLGIAGLSLSNLLRAESERQPARHKAAAKSVILLFQFGGASHHDTFDPKPRAPAEIRGEFKAIDTNVPGIQVTEHLPRLARMADKYALIRGVHHSRGNHNPGAYCALTGFSSLTDFVTMNASATDFPHPGSIVSFLDRSPRLVPPFVSLPTMIADGPFRTPGEFAGFLGKAYDPLWVLKDPNSPRFSVDELTLPDEIDVTRAGARRAMSRELDDLARLGDRVAVVKGMNDYKTRAFDLLTSSATRKAFALHEEPAAVRDRYGRYTYGQSILLARRLVEAGVRFVTVYYSAGIGGWDTHKDNFKTLKDSRLPHTDQSVSALLEDLSDRGLLDETLVYWTGDFGRTPKINKEAGRDHWPPCGTVLMAGGGIRGGQVYGASDPSGAYPKDNPASPADVVATVLYALGLDHTTELRDQLNRPMPASSGSPLLPLFS